MSKDTDWSEDRINELVRLVNDEKLRAGEIAAIMGISRNAVIGKVHRLQAKGQKIILAYSPRLDVSVKKVRAHPEPKVKKETTQVGRKKDDKRDGSALVVKPTIMTPTPVIKWRPPKPPPHNKHITLLNRDSWMCKWPTGRHNDVTTFCGKPRKDWTHHSTDETAIPYCEEHYRMSYNPPPRGTRPRPHFAR